MREDDTPRKANEFDRLNTIIAMKQMQLDHESGEHKRLSIENAKLREALIWCSGSADFAPGGQAREGWLKIQPLFTGTEEEIE